MTSAAEDARRAEDREQQQHQPGTITAPTIWVICALVLTVLLIRGAAALHLYMAVPILALNFIGFVIWVQYYRR